ncbi:Holo-[acyl-carrier-protein] synthase [compost metagenome]
MQIYCGTDIIEVDRIKNAITSNDKFKSRVFTQNEILDIDKISSDVKYQRYAGRFAAKEAVFKALSKVLKENNLTMDFIDVEVINNNELSNRPYVVITNESINNLFITKNIIIDVSISHVQAMAVAMVVVKIED